LAKEIKQIEQFTSRKRAKFAKFGEIEAGAAKKKWLVSGAFASLASWRENESEDVG
jgi:hypothetical protein